VSADAPPLFEDPTDSKSSMHLLWGDQVEVLETTGDRVRVRARGRKNTGWVEKSDLGGQPLLELYVIDVGQGDGILIKTPNGRHLMVDGGLQRQKQGSGKSAADFVDWKFFNDYGKDRIVLDAMLASHCDADHYGGLVDLLEPDETGERDCEDVRVEAVYHAGLGWWNSSKGKTLGPHQKVDGRDLFTQLVGDRAAIDAALVDGADPHLDGEWADFMQAALSARRVDGSPTPIEPLAKVNGYLPGFEPGTEGEPEIKVLAPLQPEVDGKLARLRFSSDSKSTNGNSIVLRLSFGSCRILLTGDINRECQEELLADYTEHRDEFLCDVGKACHHGSDDVSFDFLKAMSAAVTIFSSGDNEDYDHPRPTIIAASAISGYLQIDRDELISPLIYSTELARSIKIKVGAPGTPNTIAGLVYGLVNVRTDGHRILCATRNEKTREWNVATTTSRF
jgi:glyoxylase-like metal-dependent hydrolase (beta-lactamase superfamily II)